MSEDWNCEDEGHEIDTEKLGTPYLGADGEIVEINGYCLHCKGEVRDVYIFSVLLEGHNK